MGRVFLGVSAAGRPVAVKVVHAELAADPEFRVRFSTEVAAARKVSGLFTALVVDADVDAPVPWLATAYVAGPSLSEAVRSSGPLTAWSLLALAAGLAKSLTAIHAAGVVHGDLKPSNVLLAPDGPRVIDFGISQAAEAAPLARAGLVVGTPSFMAPEQAAGEEVGPRSDVFSLGAVLAFAATGRKPFGVGPPAAVLERVVRVAADLEDAPAEVRPLIEQCLAKDPLSRPTAAELLAGVTAAQSAMKPRSEPSPAGADQPGKPQARGARQHPRRLITASAVAVILGASAGYGLNAVTQHQRVADRALSQIAAGPVPKPVHSPPAPRITHTFTYQVGSRVFFEINYSDPGHNAAGFGFVGVQGSDWREQDYLFSNPANGIVAGNTIAYPLEQGCGSGQEFTSTVKAWIYNKAGVRSTPVIIHLACRT
jgi:serine/threonine protein kinase